MITMLSDSLLRASVNASLHLSKSPSPCAHTADGIPRNCKATMPSGFGGFDTIMSWAKWICLAILILALMIQGVRMAIGGRQGDGSDYAKGIGMVLAGVMIVTGAGFLITTLQTAGS